MAQTATTKPRPPAPTKVRKARKTRRIVNVRLLVISLVAVGSCGLLGFLWHRYQSGLVAGTLLQRATTLEQEEKWPEAAGYLGRYLQIEPVNADVRVRLIAAVEKSAVTGPGRHRLVSLLYQTLGVLPERDDLRLKLAQQLLDLQDYSGAKTQAEKLLDSKDDKTQRAARRIVALSLSVRARPGGLVTIAQAAEALNDALADNPGDVAVASLTANIYREFPREVGSAATPAKADAIMDRLVATDPDNAEALIARYRYRLRYDHERARADLDAALAQNADHVEALLLDTEAILAAGDKSRFAAAKENSLKVVKLRPQDPQGYLGLASLYVAEGDPQHAVDTLVEGRDKLATISLDFDYALAGLLIDLGKFTDATKIADEFSDEVGRWLPELTTAGRIKFENMNRLLQARLAFAGNDLGQATRKLNAIIASVDKASGAADSTESLLAYDLLATIMSQQHRPDLAAAHWTTVAKQAPGFRQAAWKAGIADLELGHTDDAIEQLEAYLKLPAAVPEARITLVQAQLQRQLSRPAAERNWNEFLSAIEQAKVQLPNRWEWQLAEASYMAVQPTKDAAQKASKQLLLLEQKYPKDAGLCEQLVVMYQRLGRPADAERLLDSYDELQPSVARRAILRSAVFASTNRAPQAFQLLVDAATKASPQEQRDLAVVRLRLLLATQQLKEAQELVSQLIAASPKDSQLLTTGLEIALLRRDFAAAAKWEDTLKNVSTVDSFDWRYYRSRRLIGEFSQLDAASRTELDQLIESLRSERPGWFPVVTLGGQYAELQGNRQGAIEAYQAALASGDRRPETLERLVRVLYAEGRFDDANRYLSQVKSDESAKGRFESLAIVAAVKGNRLEEARDLAQHAVDRGSQDPLHYVWLANLLQADGDQQAAEQMFRTALERFPKDVRVWNALFAHFLQTKQPERARQVLARWTEQVSMTEPQKLLILGQGNEALGDAAAAQSYYRQVVEKDPENATARFLLAKTLLSTDAATARPELLEVLRIDPTHAEARRLLAALLAATGDETDWSQAVAYLQQRSGDQQSDEAGNDDRLRAILLARKGKNRKERLANCEAARRILTTRLDQSSNAFSDVDRMLLAAVYEQEAMLGGELGSIQTARDTLRPLVDRQDVSANQLVSYIQFLLRHLQQAENAETDSTRGKELRQVFADDARLRIDELEKVLAKEPQVDRRFLPIALRMKLLEAEDRQNEGLKLLNQFVEQQLAEAKNDADRAKLYLQAGKLCSSTGSFAAAEDWYRRLEQIVPNSYVLVAQSLLQQGKADDAVELCLRAADAKPSSDVATMLAQILSSEKVGGQLDRKARPVIDAALDADRGNVELLMSVAVQRITRNDNDEAIRLFRRVVELQPKHTLALNNLATLLAERPDQLSEAQQYVERAMTVSGRLPALLDTLGTILLRSHRYDEAIVELEEAVAGSASDPRYYFHLAAAYDGARRQAEAQQALETALELGLDKAILTSGDRELLASLKHALLTANYQD